MLAKEQIEKRRTGISASEIPTVMAYYTLRGGGNVTWRYHQSATELVAHKLGKLEPWEGNAITDGGLAMEPLIADWVREELSVPIEPNDETLGTDRHFATPDGFIYAVDRSERVAGLEMKCLWDSRQTERWSEAKDGVPEEYYQQCQWCMHVTGLDEWYLVACIATGYLAAAEVASLWGAHNGGYLEPRTLHDQVERCKELHFRTYEIERNQKQIDVYAKAADKFYADFVEQGRCPEPDGTKSAQKGLDAFAPDEYDSGCMLAQNAEQEDKIDRLLEIKSERGEIRSEYKQLKQELQHVFDQAGAEGIETPDGKRVYRDSAGRIQVKD